MPSSSGMKIDLNLDAGETPKDKGEEALFQIVTSVNIACGGHAGDATTMARAVEMAKRYQLKVGAHPSFPDRKNSGREAMKIAPTDLVVSLIQQIESLGEIC